MGKPASVHFPIHNLLKHRWSPRAFADRDVDPSVLRSLFEAARWAASSYNGQPWSFIIASRGETEAFQRILSCFVEFNAGWAKGAPVIGISIAKLNFEHNGSPNRHAYHDVGQAMANLAIEAVANGLQLHQMAGILVDKAREALSIPDGYDPVAGFALGYPGDPHTLPDQLRDRELAPSERKTVDSFVYDGQWGGSRRFSHSKRPANPTDGMGETPSSRRRFQRVERTHATMFSTKSCSTSASLLPNALST